MAAPATRTKSGRLYCRLCARPASVSRNVCTACQMAEVRGHIRRRGRVAPGAAKGNAVQQAYAQAIKTAPAKRQPVPDADTSATMQGTTVGLAHGQAVAGAREAVAGMANRLSVSVAVTPKGESVASMFLRFRQHAFYKQMRAVMLSLNTVARKKRRTASPRKAPSGERKASDPANQALSRALRLLRCYMQEEMIPLALKLNCSKTQIWHIEAAQNVVQPLWVARYAKVFGFPELRLWQYACAIQDGPAADGEALDELTKFVDVVCRAKTKPKWREAGVRMKERQGTLSRKQRPGDAMPAALWG